MSDIEIWEKFTAHCISSVIGTALINHPNFCPQSLQDEIHARITALRGGKNDHFITYYVRLVQYQAAEVFVKAHLVTAKAEYRKLDNQARKNIEELEKNISKSLANSRSLIETLNIKLPNGALDKNIDPSAIRLTIEKQMFEELLELTGIDQYSDVFSRAFYGQIVGFPGWYELFATYLSWQIKTNEKFFNILFADELECVSEHGLYNQKVLQSVFDLSTLSASVLDRIFKSKGSNVESEPTPIAALFSQQADEDSDNKALLHYGALVESHTKISMLVLMVFTNPLIADNASPEVCASKLWKKVLLFGQLNSFIAPISSQVVSALNAADFVSADDLLNEIVEKTYSTSDGQLPTAPSTQNNMLAGLFYARGAIAELLDAQISAAKHYSAALERVSPIDHSYRFLLIDRLVETLLNQVQDDNDENPLKTARQIAENMIGDEPSNQNVSAYQNIAEICLGLAAQTGDMACYDEAALNYRKALSSIDKKDKLSHSWMEIHIGLAQALQNIATTTSENTATALEEAATLFEMVLNAASHDIFSLYKSAAGLGFAQTLILLGEMNKNRELLARAAHICREIIETVDGKHFPQRRAELQLCLSNSLMTFERLFPSEEAEDNKLVPAITASENALKYLSRKEYPVIWAKAQLTHAEALSLQIQKSDAPGLRNRAYQAYLRYMSDPAGKNLLDNGGFQVWQRGTDFHTKNFQFGPDRWRIGCQQDKDDNIYPIGVKRTKGRHSEYSVRLTRPAGTSDTNAISISQVLEGPVVMQSVKAGMVIFSFYARKGAGHSTAEIEIKIMATDDANAAPWSAGVFNRNKIVKVNAKTVKLLPKLKRYRLILRKFPKNVARLLVTIRYTPKGTARTDDSFTIEQAKLEVGNALTPHQPLPISLEQMLCERYFRRSDLKTNAKVLTQDMNATPKVIANDPYEFVADI